MAIVSDIWNNLNMIWVDIRGYMLSGMGLLALLNPAVTLFRLLTLNCLLFLSFAMQIITIIVPTQPLQSCFHDNLK